LSFLSLWRRFLLLLGIIVDQGGEVNEFGVLLRGALLLVLRGELVVLPTPEPSV